MASLAIVVSYCHDEALTRSPNGGVTASEKWLDATQLMSIRILAEAFEAANVTH